MKSTPSFKRVSRKEAAARPLIMGILNVTPDSFYAESRRLGEVEAVDAALRMAEEGADWIDIGGQSTRPGSDAVGLEEELRRVMPILARLASQLSLPLSIDTDKAEVARQARESGATILNDVTALRGDPGMMEEAKKFDRVILMHMKGVSPKTMQQNPFYGDVVGEVKAFLEERADAFVSAGGQRDSVLVDPGIGFGKELEHNLSLLKHLDEFAGVAPVVIGASRKSFIGKLTGEEKPEDRLEGSLAAACWAAQRGAAVVRTHDVAATRRSLAIVSAIEDAN